MRGDPAYGEVKVNKLQVSVKTAPERRDIPSQRIRLEIASVPTYIKELRALQQNYSILPDGYDTLLIPSESLDEILVDELVSLPSCARYIRHRDILDIAWLKQRGANLDADLLKDKVGDYSVVDYHRLVDAFNRRLYSIVNSADFIDQMKRFIPARTQDETLNKEGFLDYLASVNKDLLVSAADSFLGVAGPGFSI